MQEENYQVSLDAGLDLEILGDMKIKPMATKRKPRKILGDEIVKKAMRFPQLNKFFRNRAVYGFGGGFVQ